MKYISKLPTGFIFRRSIDGKIIHKFFGNTAHGGEEAARQKAAEYRREIAKVHPEGKPSQKHRRTNARNRTGIVGVSHHLRQNPRREGGVIHQFRAACADPENPGQSITRGWSVMQHGLWGAYFQAADWRSRQVFKKPADLSEVIAGFRVFLQGYYRSLSKAGVLSQEMITALIALHNDSTFPAELRQTVPTEVLLDRRARGTGAEGAVKLQLVASDGAAQPKAPLV